jgi:hypothetical protein
MKAPVFASVAAAALLGGVASFAQVPPAAPGPGYPGGVPGAGDPYARPNEMGTNDRVFDRDEQIRRGTQEALDRRAAEAGAGRARPAKAGEVKAGLAVADKSGAALGTIESVGADGAVVAGAAGKVKVPLEAFGMGRNGLLLGVTKREFDSLVAKAMAAPAG